MTAPAAAPAAGHIIVLAPRAATQPSADRFAFAAMLDSLLGVARKPGSSAAGAGTQTSGDAQQDEAPSAGPGRHPMADGEALLSGLPFALASAVATEATASAPVEAPRAALAPTKGASLGTAGESIATSVAPAKPAAARLTGERAFHLALAASSLVGPGPSPPDAAPSTDALSFAPARAADEIQKASAGRPSVSEPLPSGAGAPTREGASSVPGVSLPSAEAPPSRGDAPASKPSTAAAPRGAGAPASPAASATRAAAAQDPVRGGRKTEVAAQSPTPRVQAPAADSAKTEPGDKTADRPAPGLAQPAGQPTPQPSAFAALAPSGAAAPSARSFDPAAAEAAPRTTAPAAAPSSVAPAVKEIDVDLSPAGLEHVSMTMRLAGEKLSVVIRAASAQTAGSIEGARDAIADRLAAIGQTLDSLIVTQTGANADATANEYGASADEGSTSGQGLTRGSADGQGGSSDASSSRRGAPRDRGS